MRLSENMPTENLDTASEPEQLAAVKLNGYAIQYITNPSKSVQIAAIKRAWKAIKYINNPDGDIINLVTTIRVKENPGLILNSVNISDIVLNNCKFEIIKYLLICIKDLNFFIVQDLLKILKKYDIHWEELEIIRTSIKHDLNLRNRS